MASSLTLRTTEGGCHKLVPTTLAELGLGEEALEHAIEANIDLLALEDAGLRFAEHAVLRQVTFRGPRGGMLRPDLTILTDAGHAILVEVKRHGNAELADRSVLAQLIDYASGLASLDESSLAAALGGGASLLDVVRSRFPRAKRPDLVARDLADACQNTLRLVVACDRFPAGVEGWLRGVASQSSLAFELSVIEIRPFVAEAGAGPIVFVPTTREQTEIVARTAVVIRNEAGSDRVQVIVNVNPEDVKPESPGPELAGHDEANYPKALRVTEDRLGAAPRTLLAELKSFAVQARQEDWSDVFHALSWDEAEDASNLRNWGTRPFMWGRVGNTLCAWRPGVFVGALVNQTDHRCGFSQPDLGADFSLIVAVNRKDVTPTMDGDEFMRQPEFRQLVQRLRQESGGWNFHDHLAEVAKPNRWHPLHLRRPLVQVFEGARSADERYLRWMQAAHDTIGILLQGGELTALRERLKADVGEGW